MIQLLKTKILIIGIAGLAISSPTMACTLMIDPPRPGETVEQAALRDEHAAQVKAWDTADSVYLARVTEATEIENGGVRYTFEPIKPMRGIVPPRRLSDTWRSDRCYGRAWSRGEVAVIYAIRIRFNEDWSRWGQWVEIHALPPAAALDPRIAPALQASAENLRTSTR